MSVVIETTIGNFTVDLYTKLRPKVREKMPVKFI